MTERVNMQDPCAGCSYGQGRKRGLNEANTTLNQEVASAFDNPDSVRLGTQDQPPVSPERTLGELGSLIDRVEEITRCSGQKTALQIGPISLGNVCGWYWDNGQRLAAIALTLKPISVRRKNKF